VRPTDPSTRTSRFAEGLIVATIAAGTFAFRWLTLDFENDYFMHVAWAAEMLRGERPVHDFVEPGFPLQTMLSYVALRAGGYHLAWEGFFACSLISVSVVCTYAISRWLGAPRWLSACAALLAALAYPRLYAYPKAIVYPAAMYALMVYLHRPRLAALLAMGAATAMAFLFRHDHGAWIVGPTVLGLALGHWRQPRQLLRAVAVYGGAATACVSPWIVWVALSGHADQYFAFLFERGSGLVDRTRLPDRRFSLDSSMPLLSVAPIEYPLVGIRWVPSVSADARREREARYSLEPVPEADDRYRLRDLASENVRALVFDLAVEDTSGIDRSSLRVPSGGFAFLDLQFQRYAPINRLRVLPGVVRSSNAEPWLTWVTFTIPWIAILGGLASWVRHRHDSLRASRAALVVATAALSIVTYQTLVRASPDSRLGDIAALTAILLAWTLWQTWPLGGWPGRLVRPTMILLLALTLASAGSFGRFTTRLAAVGVDGPTNLVRRLLGVGTLFAARPLDIYSPPGANGLAGLARWLNECTFEDERLALIGFGPQVFVLAERGFAAGLAFYDLGWSSSERDQALALSRWSRQRVPVVLGMEAEWDSFSRDYPRIRSHIDDRYVMVERSAFGGGKPVIVLVERSATPARIHAATGLPCFRGASDPAGRQRVSRNTGAM
jgi:hypothetical protein